MCCCCAELRARPPRAQDTQRLHSESEQGKTQADFAELEDVIAGLAAEKLEMEATVCELMMRLEAAMKHTQALADERTFLQVHKLPAARTRHIDLPALISSCYTVPLCCSAAPCGDLS